MEVLVTGGAGYIGSVLVRTLLEKGYKVKVIDNFLYGDHGIREIKDQIQVIYGDITKGRDVLKAIKGVDAVVHLAAIVGKPSSKLLPDETIATNVLGAANVIYAAEKYDIEKFILISTCSVYGFHREGICTEETEPNPLSLYAETRLDSEKILRSSELNWTIFRLGTVFGLSPRMRFDLVANLFIAKALMDKKITVFGRGIQKRPFIHIRDVSRVILAGLENEWNHKILNVAYKNFSILQLAEEVCRNVPNSEIVLMKEKEDERSYEVSTEKLEKLGFKPKYTIKDAVKEIKKASEEGSLTYYYDTKYSNYKLLSLGVKNLFYAFD